MKLFVDSANLADIENALSKGFIEGVTTNPSLLAREPKADYLAHMRQIVSLFRKAGRMVHLTVEVIAQEPQEMARQAESFVRDLAYEQLVIRFRSTNTAALSPPWFGNSPAVASR